jgi:hypothetical protein
VGREMALLDMHYFCNISKKEGKGTSDIRDMNNNK